jgi:hypothetical protein
LVVGGKDKAQRDDAESDPLPASASCPTSGSAFLHVFAPSWLK